MTFYDYFARLRNSDRALYCSYLIMGCAVYAPWRCFTAALDYFEDTYPEKNSTKLLTMVYASFEVITLLLLTIQPIQRWKTRSFVVCFFTTSSCFASIPLIDFLLKSDDEDNDRALKMSLVVAGIVGCANAVLEACIAGTSLNLPPQYTQAFSSGTGVSGVFVAMLRVITKAAFIGVNDGLAYSAYIYFGSCSFLCLTALLSYVAIVNHHSEARASSLSPKCLLDTDSTTDQEDSLLIPSSTKNISCLTVFSKIRTELAVLILSIMSAVFVNPGIIVDENYAPMGNWYNVFLATVMMLFSFIGRSSPLKWTLTTRGGLVILGGVNFLLILISVLTLQFYSKALLFVALVCVCGFSSGYGFASCFRQATETLYGQKESAIGGSMLTFCDWIGSAAGTVATLARTKLLE